MAKILHSSEIPKPKSESSETGKAIAAMLFGIAFSALGLGWQLLSHSLPSIALLALGIVMIVAGVIRRRKASEIAEGKRSRFGKGVSR